MDERSGLNDILKAHTEIVKENTEVQKILIHAIKDNNKKNIIASIINALLVLGIVFSFFLLIYLI